MTYIARAELAAAVSEAGGLGMIETLTEDGRTDLRRVRGLTDRPVAANLTIQGASSRSFRWPRSSAAPGTARRAR